MALETLTRNITLRNPCADTRKDNVTDRAKRYRAHQSACIPSGRKECALCGSTRYLTIDHKDGDEANGARSNLRWLCKSCNTRLGARDAKQGRGKRTRQYNPGAETAAQYAYAVSTHQSEYVPGVGRVGQHDEGGAIIHDTPKAKRQKFIQEIFGARKKRKTAKDEVPF